MKIAIAIPSRYGSTRLPGKALIKLGNKPLIRHCYDQVKKFGYDTFVLTDDQRIADVIGQDAYLITGDIENGTKRITTANKQGLFKGYTHVINVQGDQPVVDKSWIDDTIEMLKQGAHATQLCTDLMPGDVDDTSCTKVVHDGKMVKWISRNFKYGYRAVAVYGFTRQFLSGVHDLKMTEEEKVESIEQLRYITNGWDFWIKKVNVPDNFVDINIPKDVEKWYDSR